MSRRVLTNLISFAALGAVLIAWALTSIVTVDAVNRPYTVTADFASSPGLRGDLEVAYLGVRVGTVGDVRLRPGRVAVRLKLDRGTVVPSGAHATVLRKSAIGEPYVELSPPPGPGGRPLRAGDHIPLSRTSVTVEYKRVFDSTGPLIRSIPPEDARTLTGELGTGLEGRGTTLRDLMGDSHQLARTLAAEAAVLDSLSVQLTALTGTLAASGPELGSGVNDLASFTASLRASRKDLDGLLRDGPRFLDEVNGLLKDSRPAMRCTLYALGAQSPPLFTDTTTRELRHALTVIASGIPGFAESITHERPEGTYIRIKPVITLPGVAPDSAHYQQEVPEPILPPLYECVGDKQEAPVRPNPEPTPEATRVGTSQGPFITTDPRGADAPTTSPWSRRLPMLPVLVASLVLAYAAFRLGTTIRRYRRIR